MTTRFGTTKQGKIYLAASFVLMAGSVYVIAAHARRQGSPPIYTTGTDVADPNQAGNIDQAMQQTQQVLTALQAVNYDPVQLPDLNILTLPDAQFAEDETYRQPDMTSYSIPDGSVPEHNQIACYTDIYARRNRSYYTGDTSSATPSGYYIVAWKNGTIQKVAVGDIRLIPSVNGGVVDCFPGMTGYNPALPVWGQ